MGFNSTNLFLSYLPLHSMKVYFYNVFLCYLLLAIAGIQFVYAQHSTEHLDHGTTQHGSDDNEHGSEICQTCVTAKVLTHSFLSQTACYLTIQKAGYQSFNLQLFNNLQSFNKPFRSQAPPILFS